MEHLNPAALRDSRRVGPRVRSLSAVRWSDDRKGRGRALCALHPDRRNGCWYALGRLERVGAAGSAGALPRRDRGRGKFFQILASWPRTPGQPGRSEVMYVCLEPGFEGRYRPRRWQQLEAIRQRVLSIIRKQRGEYERDLSASWQGVPTANQRQLGWLPLWVVGAVTALLLIGIYAGFRLSLTSASDTIATKIASLRIPAPSLPVPKPKPSEEPRLAPLLAEEVRQGRVAVDDRRDRSVVTVLGGSLFKPGDGAVSTQELALFGRIGEAPRSGRARSK